MRLKAIGSLVVLMVILLIGNSAVKAETTSESLKSLFNKGVTSAEKANFTFAQKQKIREMNKVLTSGKKWSESESANRHAAAKAGEEYPPIYEVEPNDSISQANPLRLDEIALGTLDYYDIDTYKINVTKSGPLAVLGLMDEYAFSEIGFLLFDKNDNLVDIEDIYQEGKLLVEFYTIKAGTYYIKAFNLNDYYGDGYALMATMNFGDEDTTPPAAPQVDRVNDKDNVLRGTAEAGSVIEVSVNGSVVGTAITGANGKFTVSIPVYPAGTVLSVTATDSAGNKSKATKITVASSTFTGWVVENGKRYYYTNGVKNTGWFFQNGKYYFLDKTSGAMVTGWLFTENKWFFLDKQSGEKKAGWIFDGGKWYYLDAYGVMKTGWVKDRGAWYYLNSNGSMKTGWLKSGKDWYYLGGNGAMKTGWIKDGAKWYYLYSSGKMASSTKIGTYRLGADGAWIK
ncbi:Ig-like domain-containing protein [Neobacillus novalis]|uniref:Ig-like domain-containing protein n=1 Tax=Neobacillus novalis TaxID=220687 RepID=A0AA95MLH3_9BACI|nr:Ig-like domain-containing protein [Neobacillus novalis]WHY85382.1 Ig-like domain-containing protein [Neobacillus novalis]